MDNNEGFIVGTCREMCPESEIREREKAGLIHFFERADDQPSRTIQQDNSSRRGGHRGRGGGRQQNQRRFQEIMKADKERAVKSYSRPAAGVNKTISSDLRPPLILKKTVAYLCTKILLRTDLPFIDVYDFVFDRLRAVRQDIVIQRICDETAILILESIVKFHVYAEYKFRYNAPTSYDPAINQKHLRDCLKTLLSFYGINGYHGASRQFFESLYCLGSPENYEVISRAFEIKTDMKDSPVFIDSLEICLAIQNRNFFKFFQLLNELPPLLAAYCLQRASLMRMYALKAISLAYGVQSCKIPLEWIEEILCYPNATSTEKDMIRIGCQIVQPEEEKDAKFVKFSKSSSILTLPDCGISVNPDVKFTVLSGLNNTEMIAKEQICPWAQQCL